MEKALLIHNPTAGSGKHLKSDLKEKIEAAGYQVKYYSTSVPGWEKFTGEKAEVIFVAGGDGTVQKLAKEMLKTGGAFKKTPIQILPMGTANNIAVTLGLDKKLEKLVKITAAAGFDSGNVKGAGENKFFIEGIGFGIFPRLVKVMEAIEDKDPNLEDPEEELQRSLKELLKIIEGYKAKEAILIADQEEITGKFLLVEIMNIRFIGPNFELAPNAEPGDGKFELVIIPEDKRKELAIFVSNLINRKKNEFSLNDFGYLKKVSTVRIKWEGQDFHVDDESIDHNSGTEIIVTNHHNSFNFRRDY